jgi:DNA primase
MNRTTVENIKARLSIEDVIGGYIKLEKAGKSYRARCPFHNEKTPSFFVSPDRGGYYCFGCNAKGDIFSFVEQFEGLDFKGALKVLADKAGVPLVINEKVDNERDRLFQIMEEAAQFFEQQLEKSKEAKEYLKKRGISPETIKLFRIGWAPEGWHHTLNHLKGKKWNESVIEKAGLIKKSDRGVGYSVESVGKSQNATNSSGESRTDSAPTTNNQQPITTSFYDRFRGRVMFPILDSSGRVIAFTGRILKEDDKSAKYLNSPETPIFSKASVLFALDKAKAEIRRLNYSILVEGQMDCVLSHQAGVKNTVAASGTALTDQITNANGVVSNLGLVKRLSPNMIIALDADHAGRVAAMKAVAATAIGLGMSVKIANIKGGKDPADLILANPEDWKNVLKNAEHVIEFELGNVLEETKDRHKVPAALRERVFPFLTRMESEMDKAFYIKLISEKTGLAEAAVWEDVRKVVGSKSLVVGNRTSGSSSAVLSHDQLPTTNYQLPTTTAPHHIDIVERRLYGLLALMESLKLPAAAQFREQIRTISGDSYDLRMKMIEPLLGDLSYEAESMYGTSPERFDLHIKELLLNFEENCINEQLMKTMHDLREFEKAGNNAKVAELAKKCQELSMKKAEILKKRK